MLKFDKYLQGNTEELRFKLYAKQMEFIARFLCNRNQPFAQTAD